MSAPQPTPGPTRFGQLTYTSFDAPERGRAAGGWQVKDVSDGVSAAEQEFMRAGVATRFDSVQALPQFPAPADIAARPRRLVYAPTETGGCYWHTAPAGADASGRPGNVFAHVVVDRGSDAAVRPIERWGSPDWLVPYGADAVAAAELPDNAPAPGGISDRAAVLDFLLDPGTWRVGVLGVLLDAVDQAMHGGPGVVLGCADSENAARWIGAVSHFMSPGASQKLGWSTADRSSTVVDTLSRGVHLACVPPGDAVDGIAGCVVLGETDTHEVGEWGGEPHRTATGQLVPVTAWSVLAQTVLVDPDSARRALDHQDILAAAVGDRDLAAAWPLAMAVIANPALHDALPEATAVVLAQSPDALASFPDELAIVGHVVDEHLPGNMDEACRVVAEWQRCGGPAPVVWDVAGRVLTYRALADREWIRASGPTEFALFETWPHSEDLEREAEKALSTLVQSQGTDPAAAAHDAVKTLDLLLHAHLVGDSGQHLAAQLLDRVVVPVLCDHAAGPALVSGLGAVGTVTYRLLQAAVAGHPDFAGRPLGARLAPEVLRWLVDEVRVPTSDELTAAPSRSAEPLCAIVADAVFSVVNSGTEDHKRAWEGYAPLALSRALYEASAGGWAPCDIDALVDAYPWTLAQWCELVSAFPDHVSPRFLLPVLVLEPWGPEVEMLVKHIDANRGSTSVSGGTHPVDALAVSWALIRAQDQWDNIDDPRLRRALERHGWPVLKDYGDACPAQLPPDLLVRLAVVAVAGFQFFPPHNGTYMPTMPAEHIDALARAVDADSDFAITALVDLVRSGALNEHWVVRSAVLSSPVAPHIESVLSRDDLLCRLQVGPAQARRSLLEQVASIVMGDGDYRGPVGAYEVSAALRAEMRERHDVGDRFRAGDAYARFASSWLEDVESGFVLLAHERSGRR
ncbi:hypothetical protein JOJ86_006238 [Rhodococcus percolatus]|uniref:GAP1-N2 domain-containing protein n=1 Tax=Rhodococcus opacus TaxID=37919 RepID=UPI0015FE4569|nr:hypothetical protein [Rhodococcus opacus]MBA8964960.1 hypothetical protein [Rhodococcus opacus]MBP2208512.1 hypothetical protein [Rhodococcus opacus]